MAATGPTDSTNHMEGSKKLSTTTSASPNALKGKQQMGVENENDKPDSRDARMQPRQTTLSLVPNPSRAPVVFIARGRQPFKVFCDHDEDLTQDATQFPCAEPIREPLSLVRTDFSSFCFDVDDNDENIDPLANNSVTSSMPSIPSLSTIVDDSCGTEGEDDEEVDSVYESLVDSSEYFTAPLTNEREQHEDRALCHPDYSGDIYEYMRFREQQLRPKANYLSKQSDINAEMRVILVDWLADVAVEYDFSSETLHLAVSLVDRTLSLMDCPRLKLQLVGATAVMIASKFEEIYPPEIKEFVYITDDTYTASQILRMEKVILSGLRFQVSAPTSNWFGGRLARKARSSRRTVCTMNYLLELALLEHLYLAYRPSVVACAALCLANILTGCAPWPAFLEADSGVQVSDMFEVVSQLLRSFTVAPKSHPKAVYEKYSDVKHESVAFLPAPASLPAVS